jgi:hypothetical protein
MKIFVVNPDTNELIPIADSAIHFYADSGELLLAEDIAEVLDQCLVQELEAAE